MRVKICGITGSEDMRVAVAAGADAIGLNFVGGPRRIELDAARRILEQVPAFITPVALVRIEEGRLADELAEFLGEFWVSHLQLYGDWTEDGLEPLLADGFKPMPVVAVRDANFPETINSLPSQLRQALHGIVLDTYDPDRAGGTGKTFTWSWVMQARQSNLLADWPPVVLAGGLNGDNVGEAVRVVQPYAVDVSSGVEYAGQPGKKNPELMSKFVRSAKQTSVNLL